MRSEPARVTHTLMGVASVFFVVSAFISPEFAQATEPGITTGPSCPCQSSAQKENNPSLARLPKALDDGDEIAALESIQTGLTKMDDGSPYVWKRANGRISGIIRPTTTFRAPDGNICRHVVVLLTTGFKTATTEGVACRLATGRWRLEG